jgi:hypothetical protein
MKQSETEKLKTKGRFQAPVQTSAGHWIIDKQWQLKANPAFRESERKREEFDK